MKKVLLIAAMAVGLSASAVEYKGFSYTLSNSLIQTDVEGLTFEDGVPVQDTQVYHKQKCWFETWFDTAYTPAIKNDDKTTVKGSALGEDGTELTSSASKIYENREDLHGSRLVATFGDQDMAYATVPATADCPNGAAVDGGDIRFRLVFGAKPNRVNDVDNPWGAYFYDEAGTTEINGVFIGVKAPSNARVECHVSCPAVNTKDGWGKIVRTTIFKFDTPLTGEYQELTSGGPTNDDTSYKYVVSSYPKGYPVKYIDVVFYGLTIGQTVALRGLQTLHSGYTPVTMAVQSGIEAIGADEAIGTDAPAEYFDLTGRRVANPASGIYICRQGNKVTKIAL